LAKNIEAQGIRVGYIIGGILAVLLSALLIILFLPDFLTLAFGIPQIWDLRTPITNLVGTNIMDYFTTWGPAGIMVLFFMIYFVCMSARQSKSATMFRLSGMFGALGCSLPYVFYALVAMNVFESTSNIANYVGYAVLGNFVLALLFYILGLILRHKQKFHKNKASTTLVFCVTFWLALACVQSIYYVGYVFKIDAILEIFQKANEFLLVTSNIFSILAVYLLISAVWMFLTVPHHVRVQYNADTPNMSRPEMSVAEQASQVRLTPEEEALAKERSAQAITNSGAPVTQPLNAYPDQNKSNLPNPYRRKPLQPIPTSPQMTQPRNFNPQASTQNFAPIRQVGGQNNNMTPYGAQPTNNVITPSSPYNASNPNAMPNQVQQNSYNASRPVTQPQYNAPNFQHPMQQQNAQPVQQAPQPRPLQQPYNPQGQTYARPQVQQPYIASQPARTVAQNPNAVPYQQRPTIQQTPRQQFPAPQQRPTVQQAPRQFPFQQQPIQQPRPVQQPYNPTLQGQRPVYPQQPNVVNNPNNYIPNNIRPNNQNGTNGNNGNNGNNGY